MVEVTHAVPSKHAMMLPLQYTDPTHRTMPGPGGRHCLTHSTVVPSLFTEKKKFSQADSEQGYN